MTLPRPAILIVDDRHENLVALTTILAELDAELIPCLNGNDALTASLDHDFALALLDVQMPDMSGYELAELLRGDSRSQNLPLIFLTANDSDEKQLFQGYAAGAVDYLTKPFSALVLRSKIQVFLDLDRQRRELILHQEHLESLVAARTEELAAALLLAQAGVRAKTAFLANIGHEIRTPLNAIFGYAQILQMSPQLRPEDKNALAAILRGSHRLLNTLLDLIEYSDLKSNPPPAQTQDLALPHFLSDILIPYQRQAAARGLDCPAAAAPAVTLRTDPDKLRRILTKLLDNAVKFTPRGSIRLSARWQLGRLILELADSGCGIAPEVLPKLFITPFVNPSCGAEQGGGLGLGLALAQAYTELLGGALSVASRPGQGSTFRLAIPCDLRPEIAPAPCSLPPELRHRLLHAASRGDFEQLENLFAEIAPADPAAAQRLRQAMDDFDLKPLP